jgi:hypothetical protein
MENTKQLKRFKFRDDASKYAKNVNDILSDIGESLDKFAFTRYDNETREYIVNMIFGQHLGTKE